jgi:hypothetical protein
MKCLHINSYKYDDGANISGCHHRSRYRHQHPTRRRHRNVAGEELCHLFTPPGRFRPIVSFRYSPGILIYLVCTLTVPEVVSLRSVDKLNPVSFVLRNIFRYGFCL